MIALAAGGVSLLLTPSATRGRVITNVAPIALR